MYQNFKQQNFPEAMTGPKAWAVALKRRLKLHRVHVDLVSSHLPATVDPSDSSVIYSSLLTEVKLQYNESTHLVWWSGLRNANRWHYASFNTFYMETFPLRRKRPLKFLCPPLHSSPRAVTRLKNESQLRNWSSNVIGPFPVQRYLKEIHENAVELGNTILRRLAQAVYM